MPLTGDRNYSPRLIIQREDVYKCREPATFCLVKLHLEQDCKSMPKLQRTWACCLAIISIIFQISYLII